MADEIQFIYFDLGNVLVTFQHRRVCQQMAKVAEVPAELVHQFFDETDFQNDLECGRCSFDEAYEGFAQYIGKRPSKPDLQHAAAAIFDVNAEIVPIVAQLVCANRRLGVLSNTSATHWNYLANGRIGMLSHFFEVQALSFEIGAMKPDPRIYQVAADLAGVPPQSILFTDDLPENVAGAKACGYQAVPYQGAVKFAQTLRSKRIRFNY